MTTWISADYVFDGITLHADHAVGFEGGRVSAVRPTSTVVEQVKRHHTGILSPGFFDIQVNGGGGVMLNSTPTAEGIAQIAQAHRSFGTVALMPTVITDTPEVLARAVDAAIDARDVPGVMGLHIEGPHISRTRRGTHDARYLRPTDATTLAHVTRLRHAGLSVLITVAPENVSTAQITQLAEMGAVVSLGHTDVDARTAQQSIAAGATCFTHLFNAMSPMLSRAPGVTGAAIASEAWCSIIADGKHVDPAMVALAVRARPVADRMIAVSDAMATVGGPDHFTLYGQTIRLRDGRLVNAEGALAGAHLTMAEALRNLISYGISPLDALRMCRQNPAQMMGVADKMTLIGTSLADMITLDAEYRVTGAVQLT